jgi:spore coat protein H
MINSLSNEEFEKEIDQVLDIGQYFRWLTGVICTQNFDGFIHNYALYHNGATNLIEISPWDYDGTWGRDLHGRPIEYDFIPITGYNTLTGRLLNFSYFKKIYSEILSKTLKDEFTVSVQGPIIDELFRSLTPYISLDPYIKSSEEVFEKEKTVILNFIQQRNAYLNQQLNKLL